MTSDAIIATGILTVMCLAMWFLARLAKRRMGIGSGVVAQDALRIVGKRPLDQKSALYVIEIAGGRHILIGSGVDGTVTKLDDISAEEYALMADADDKPAAKIRSIASKPAADDSDTPDDETPEQRFATVGESFQLLLGKAKDARTNKKASGE